MKNMPIPNCVFGHSLGLGRNLYPLSTRQPKIAVIENIQVFAEKLDNPLAAEAQVSVTEDTISLGNSHFRYVVLDRLLILCTRNFGK